MLGDTRDDGNIFYEEKGSKYACTVSHHRTNEYNRISDSMKVRQEMKKQSFSIKVGDRVGIYFAMMGGGTGEYGISYVEWIYELREVGTTP